VDLRNELEAKATFPQSMLVDASHDIAVDAPDAVVDAIRSLLAKV
jgi:hypothetical protein